MTEVRLRALVGEFVETLNGLVRGVLDTPTRFDAEVVPHRQLAIVRPPCPEADKVPAIPLIRAKGGNEAPALFLGVTYKVAMDANDTHLQVLTSTISLRVDVTGGKRVPRPLVRVEYDRDQLRPGRTAAHVHLHANAPEMAWVYGSGGQPAPDLHSLHFPVGGRRFRPTLEDFLLFLDREGLYTDWKDGWRPKLIQSLEEWERLQARATARQFPEEAVSALEALGYGVTAPKDEA
ncbi:MAG: hypothetical protein OXH20_12730 [bacterium]|nr:hypothetical protein [bacterium]MXZ29819.1 hypothetical protein [Acidimicrobiia bacterium]